jgi:anion-transporting  ArsA/GET3 family ATPase
MGKGGVGKTTIAAAIAVELAARGHQVHLSTTDPAAHIADVAGDTPELTVHRIDPKLETARYTQEVLDTAGAGLTPEGRALLEEDLRSPCTEEIAVFRAFAQTVEIGASGFVVLDTAPTGHTLLLLDAAEAYHREVLRTQSAMPDAVRNLLPRLRDAAYTKVLIVTLPEATPVHEAARLQQDLHRAGIPTHAWIINQSFSAASHTFRDPVLAERGRREIPFLCEVREKLASQVITVPWTPDPPVGPEKLRQLVASPQPDPGKRIEQLMPKLRAFLAKRIANPADVDDLAQDVLLRVHQSAGQLTDETRMHAWIWQIARNAVIDHYRHGSKRPAIVDLRELDLPPVQEDRRPDVEEIVTSCLSEIEGLPHAEIAARLSLSVSGVKSRVQRGRAKLREAMLACCQFEFDRDGRIVGFRRNAPDCVAGVC